MTAPSSTRILVVAIAATLLVALLGAGLLYALRRRSITTVFNATVVTAVAILATGVLASTATALRGDQLGQLLAAMSIAAVLSVVLGAVLAKVIMVASVKLRLAVRLLDEQPELHLVDTPTAELRGVAAELAATQQRLAEARARQRAAESSRRELLAWIGHDLRTPLSRLRAMTEGLEDDVLEGPEVAQYHRAVRLQADRLAELVDDVFELATIDAGELRPALVRVALDDLISDTLASAQPIAHAKQVTLSGHAPRGLAVDADPRMLNRALDNLLSNALEATAPGGTIDVVAGERRDGVWVQVSDACGGIPDDAIARVFDAGFRVESSRPSDGRGGLGLAIARGFLRGLGGDLSVRNTDVGCTFLAVLPKRS